MMWPCHTVALLLALMMTCLEPHTVSATLPPPDRSYNILMMLPMSSRSHHNVFMPLATALTERGHKITMLSNHDPTADDDKRITYINHNLSENREVETNMFEMRDNTDKMMDFLSLVLPEIAKNLYTIPIVKELYKKRDEFDLIVIDSLFNELTYPFAHEKTFITVATAGVESMQSATLGNIQNSAYFCTIFHDFPIPMTFWQRFANVFFSIVVPLQWRYNMVIPKVQREVSKHFPDLPPLLEIERNLSLVLLNSHFSLSTPLPLVPGQIEVGCMHCRPGKPLPKDINDFVSGPLPVVYFSLGSVAQGTTIPAEYKNILISAFTKLPYKVIWKFEEAIDDLPANVMIVKWMPQQDILAHPNVKLFISHCGLLSSQEAMYHGTPVLGLPIFGDQPRNAKRLEDKGIGKMLLWEDLTEEAVTSAIKELVSNPSFHAEISAVSTIFRDQLESPVDRAVFWTEYVIRHSGAVHLRSPERDLSWIQVLHLDILLALHVIVYLIWLGLRKMLRVCCQFTAPGKNKSKRD